MIYLILILGSLLRLISLNQSLWLDEGTTALVAKMSLGNIFTKFLPGDFHPPLYYLILKYWTLLVGNSEIALRAPSIIFGLGTIILTYFIGKKLFDKKVGLLAGALMATSGLAIYYSQEARMYGLAAFFVASAIYLFLEKKWLLFSIVLALIGLTDYISLFVIPVFFVIGFKYWKKLALSLIPLILSFALWLPIFIRQITSGLAVEGSGWWNILGQPTIKNLALIPVKFMLGRISFENKSLYAVVAVLVGLLFGFLIYKAGKASRLLWAWLVLPIVLGLVVSFKVPTLTYFRFLFSLAPFYLLLAKGVFETGKAGKIFMGTLILLNLVTSGYYLISPRFQREDWRGAAKFIESNKAENSITIFPGSSNMEAYLYYAPDAKIAGPEGIEAGYNQIWLMDYLSSIFDTKGAAKSNVEALGYREKASYRFRGVGQINLYENSN
jgi:uncharacterized membrane protein